MMANIVVIVVVLLACAAAAILAWRSDVRAWNKGWCPCGGRWRTFDMDSQGGLGHKCSSCSNVIWTSWIDVHQRIEVRK